MQVNSNSYYLSAYAASASYANSNFSMTGSYFEATGSTSSINTQDKSEVSDTAKELANRIKELDIFKVIFPNNDARQQTKSLDEVGSDFANDFSSFASMFGSMASMMGLDMPQGLTMGLDGKGGMTVGGNSDAADTLRSALNNGSASSQTFTARFAVMAARGTLADAANSIDGFDEAYAKDPVAAIKDNIDALKDGLLGFRTSASNGEMSYGFMRSFSMKVEYSSNSVSYNNVNDTEEEPKAEEPTEDEVETEDVA